MKLEPNLNQTRQAKVLSSNHCCRAQTISSTHSECVSVTLFIQHAVRMHHIILPSVACLAPPYFLTLSHKRHDFRKKVTEYKMCVLSFYTTFSKQFLIVRRIERYIIINVRRPSCKVLVILVRF
jgi:hypothetical protein